MSTSQEGMPVFLDRVYQYKHIAVLAGFPNHSRHVGNALRDLPSGSTVPWQRVISSSGYISPRGDNGLSVQRQRDALMMEGVEVVTVSGGGVRVEVRGGGKERVDLKRFGWFPDVGTVGDW